MFTRLVVLFLLVVICQKMFAKSTEGLSQNKRAIRERERRVSHKQRKRHYVFVSDYVSTKYKNIYQEANAVYNELLAIYPDKLDLTKTYRYKKWKKETIQSYQGTDPQSVPVGADVENTEESSVPAGADVENTEESSVPAEADVENPNNEESSIPVQAEVEIQSSQDSEILDPESASIDEMERAINNIIREIEKDTQITNYLPLIEQNELDEVFW